MAITITGGPAYGLSWNKTADTYTRVASANGLTAGAAFDAIAPWTMQRCNMWDDGTVTAVYGDRCYTDTDVDNMGQCMVRIPKFYYYSEYNAGTTTYYWFVTTNAATTVDVGLGVGAQAVKLHPAFSRDGATRSYIYPSAYEGYFNATTSKLESKVGVQPTDTKTLAEFRTAAQLRAGVANKWEILDYLTTSAIQLLYLIEYGGFYSQSLLGVGITDMTDDGVHNMSSNTGHTASLGNASGVAGHYNEHDPSQHTYAMSYRGIENIYGNMHTFIDGINIKADYMPWIADHDFASDLFAHPYTDTGLVAYNAEDWASNILYGVGLDYGFLAVAGGASATTKLTDKWIHATGNTVMTYGGRWNTSTSAGMFYHRIDATSASVSRSYNARLEYVG